MQEERLALIFKCRHREISGNLILDIDFERNEKG